MKSWILLRNLPRLCQSLQTPLCLQQTRNFAAAPPAKKSMGKGGGKVKKILDVETDPHKLTKYVCGSNYKIDGEDVEIKPDSEYPDWLFTMDVKRPKPNSWEMEDKNTIAFYEQCREEATWKFKRLHKQGLLGLRDKK